MVVRRRNRDGSIVRGEIVVLVMPFGVLGLCVEANFERVLSMMSSEPNPCNRLISRLGNVLFC